MSDPNPSPPESQPPIPRRRTVAFPVAITLACAAILTGGFVFGAFATCNFMSSHPTKWFAFFSWASLVGLALIVLCVVFLALWGIWQIAKKMRGN